jgi:hypothetical protein
MLRLQRERMQEGLISSIDDYHRDFGLTAERLRRAAADAVVLHPGPMNRGVEIDDDVADGPQSLILNRSPTAWPCAWPCWKRCSATTGARPRTERSAHQDQRSRISVASPRKLRKPIMSVTVVRITGRRAQHQSPRASMPALRKQPLP